MSANRAARALGISDVTMRIWVRAAKPAGTLCPVVVTTGEPKEPSRARTTTMDPPMLTLRTAQGHELGPLNVETAVAMLRALS